ncbi:MAG: hypothetical protein PHC88_01550 [Terrimicrobiaceae bacterium]|nr:hypothetical protein [Terrimicrobiaceae bacterium]
MKAPLLCLVLSIAALAGCATVNEPAPAPGGPQNHAAKVDQAAPITGGAVFNSY